MNRAGPVPIVRAIEKKEEMSMMGFRVIASLSLMAVAATGCSSLLTETGSAVAGIAGGGVASAITSDAGVAAGIGIGVQAGMRTFIQYGQRKVHTEAQTQIAQVAGPLAVGEIARWQSTLSLPLEPEEAGRVTVSRVIASGALDCKEIVFSIDLTSEGNAGGDATKQPTEPVLQSRFYVASICKDSNAGWQWAAAEPATGRWGSLQ